MRELLLWRGPAPIAYISKRPHVREGAPHQETRNCLTLIHTIIWSLGPDGVYNQDRLTAGRNIILTMTILYGVNPFENYITGN
jgi:hypothetical protein